MLNNLTQNPANNSQAPAVQPVTPNTAAPITPAVPVTPAAPATPAAPVQEPGNNEGGIYVTKADLEAFRKDVLQDVQSKAGKFNAKVLQRLNDLQSHGISATKESVEKLVTSEEARENQSQVTPPTAPAATPAPARVATSSDPVIAKAQTWMIEDGVENPNGFAQEAYRLMAAGDMRLTESDPETQGFKAITNATDLLNAVKQAIVQKRERLAANGTPAAIPTLGTGGGSFTPSHTELRGLDTLDQYFKTKK
jgi:hypothetical protein